MNNVSFINLYFVLGRRITKNSAKKKPFKITSYTVLKNSDSLSFTDIQCIT